MSIKTTNMMNCNEKDYVIGKMKSPQAGCRKSVGSNTIHCFFVIECIKDVVVFEVDGSRMISLNVAYTHVTKQIQPDKSPELEFKGPNCYCSTCEVFLSW